MKFVCGFIGLLSIFALIDGHKILGVIPLTSKSHFAIGHSIVKSLKDVGHDITVLSPYPQKKPIENYRDISTSDLIDKFLESQHNSFFLSKIPTVFMFPFLFKLGGDIVDAYMEHSEVQKFMRSGEKFDVCIIEIFNIEALLGLADHFGCTLIGYTTFGAVQLIDSMTANQSPASYVPHPFLQFTDQMTFTERLSNTFHTLVEEIGFTLYHLPNQKKLYNKYFPNAKKSFDEIHKSPAIIFMNNHVSSSSARPYLPNMIEIGGIHVEPAKPLPADIKQFLDSATDGAILFSMGSSIKSKDWEVSKREAFVKAFGKLKQKVIWKYENETLPGNPGNIKIGSWIPQRDIIAHPNIKLFITHGGLLGTTEAVVEGVPVLGLPIFGDQKMNMAKAEARGYGLQVALDDISEKTISKALNEILTNPKYAKNAKEISSRFIDRPLTPQQSVVYWTEYAIKHKGAPHLKAAGNSLSFIEFHLIDVYMTLLAILVAILYIDFIILKIILRKLFKKPEIIEKSRKQKRN